MRDLFQDVAPDVEITALSTNPTQTRETCGVESIPLMSPRKYLSDPSDYRRAFAEADAVLVTGGTPFYDWDHASRIIHMGLARRGGKPLLCLGVGAKRIESLHGRLITSRLLSGARRLSARDPVSQTRLSGLTGRAVALTGDSALWMRPSQVRRRRFELGKEVVVIAPRALAESNRGHYHDPVSADVIRDIRSSLTRLADDLVGKGYTVVFLPMHSSPLDDDTHEIDLIRFRMRGNAIRVGRPLHPRECSAFLGSASLVVGLRLHSLILAAARGVPVVSVGYDEKIGSFMEYAGAADCVVSPDGLRERSFELLMDDGGLGRRLRSSCAEMKLRIRDEATVIMSLLSG